MHKPEENEKYQETILTGVIGFFDDPDQLMEATQKVKEAGFKDFDAFTPYPVHGLDDAQGLRRSRIPYVTFVAGVTGCSLGFLLQYWTSAVDWPLIVGGKPFNSWPAFVPIMFECTILFAGLSTLAALLFCNRLPNIRKRVFDPSLTRDRFAIVIEAPAPVVVDEDEHDEDRQRRESREAKARKNHRNFVESEALEFLKKVGAKDVKSVFAEGWF